MDSEPKTNTATPKLEDLILSGPLNNDDLTFTIVKEKSKLGTEKYEEGLPIKTFPQDAEKQDVWGEFKTLESVTFDKKVMEKLCDDDDVKPFNRYSDILPYRTNPVTLPKDSYGDNSYINASYVSSSIKNDDKSFIVCQSPLESTIIDFWRMVIKEQIHTIIMLCKFKAGTRVQSCEYFPDSSDRQFDGFKQVKLVAKIVNTELNLTTRQFKIEYGTETRDVTHYQWEGWPDHGVPDKSQHVVLFDLVKSIRDRRKADNHPILVHCSAGIGRSGTLVALHNIAQIVEAYNRAKEQGENVNEDKAKISIFSVVRRLREQRFGMVQTVAQYELLYELTTEIVQNPKLLQSS